MKPLLMPIAWFSTCATGARQLVVQEAFDTTVSAAVRVLWLTPKTMVLSAPADGAETRTRLEPFSRCTAALSRSVKMQVGACLQIDLDAPVAGGQADFLEAVDVGQGLRIHCVHLARDLMPFAGQVNEPRCAILLRQPDDVQREALAGPEGAGDPLALVQAVVGEALFQGAVDEQEDGHGGR